MAQPLKPFFSQPDSPELDRLGPSRLEEHQGLEANLGYIEFKSSQTQNKPKQPGLQSGCEASLGNSETCLKIKEDWSTGQ